MGEATPTNWSSLLSMIRKAVEEGKYIYLLGSKLAPDGYKHGIDVFAIPKDVDPNYLDLTEDSDDWSKYHLAWLWAILITGEELGRKITEPTHAVHITPSGVCFEQDQMEEGRHYSFRFLGTEMVARRRGESIDVFQVEEE